MMTQSAQATSSDVHYRTVKVGGVEIFYREAGNPKSPTILLLHFKALSLICISYDGEGAFIIPISTTAALARELKAALCAIAFSAASMPFVTPSHRRIVAPAALGSNAALIGDPRLIASPL